MNPENLKEEYLKLTLGSSHGSDWTHKLSARWWSVGSGSEFLAETVPFVESVAVAQIPRDDDHTQKLRELREEIGDCQRCPLSQTRTNIVYGEGNPDTKLMFVGEGPGENEDLQGRPFVGKAGELLDRMIQAMGFARQDIYIANVVKCRPPQNRTPEPAEMAECKPFLLKQIEIIRPKIIVVLGATALRALLGETQRITQARGKWQWLWSSLPPNSEENIAVMPTFHPAFLLRNPAAKKEVWVDLQEVMKKLNN